MPAFLGLLTALGPAATGAALALAPAASPHTPALRETCSYTLTFVANGALLTGTCEGRIATWRWRPFFWTPGSGDPGEAVTDVPVADGGAQGGADDGRVDEMEVGGWGRDGREAADQGAGEGAADGGEADAAPGVRPGVAPSGGPGDAPGLAPGSEPAAVPGSEPVVVPGSEPVVVPDADPAPGPDADPAAGPGVRPEGPVGDRKKSGGARGWSPGHIAATAALGQLGTPFSWGGGSAAGPTKGIGRGSRTSGFDCSGLTLYAWAKAGVRLGHYTGAQFRQGRRIALGDLRAGDLVFFGGGGGDPTHVGLYLQDGVMIHAPKTGDVVKKTNFVKSSYFGTRYRGAVRPRG